MKIVINRCFGGFGVSKVCSELMAKKGNKKAKAELKKNKKEDMWYGCAFDDHSLRTDPDLISAVEELGRKASGNCAELTIIEIPDETKYTIEEYDGLESVHAVHESWS